MLNNLLGATAQECLNKSEGLLRARAECWTSTTVGNWILNGLAGIILIYLVKIVYEHTVGKGKDKYGGEGGTDDVKKLVFKVAILGIAGLIAAFPGVLFGFIDSIGGVFVTNNN